MRLVPSQEHCSGHLPISVNAAVVCKVWSTFCNIKSKVTSRINCAISDRVGISLVYKKFYFEISLNNAAGDGLFVGSILKKSRKVKTLVNKTSQFLILFSELYNPVS
jgi:hypothetical protein